MTDNVTAIARMTYPLCGQYLEARRRWRWADGEAPTCLFCVAARARWRRG